MANNKPIFDGGLDDVLRNTPIGSVEKSISNTLYGINHRQSKPFVKKSNDHYGLTFMVRPQLNLSTDNIRNIRQFYNLLNDNELSIQRWVRCTLDPRLQAGGSDGNIIPCPVVDNNMAFIPIVTNTISNISGWPDIVTPTFTSSEGLYKEQYSQVDGSTMIYNSYDIDLTFRNMIGNPLIYLFYVWLYYEAMVFEGKLMPYPDFITENEIDYMTRIYRLILDPTKRYVRGIGATGVAFPLSTPMGQFFDFTDEKPYMDQTSQFTIRFRALGAEYMDDILVKEFNETVCIFNPKMRDVLENPDGALSMVKVPKELLLFFNNRGYPLIRQETYELEWWISGNVYDRAVGNIPEDMMEQYLNGG